MNVEASQVSKGLAFGEPFLKDAPSPLNEDHPALNLPLSRTV